MTTQKIRPILRDILEKVDVSYILLFADSKSHTGFSIVTHNHLVTTLDDLELPSVILRCLN